MAPQETSEAPEEPDEPERSPRPPAPPDEQPPLPPVPVPRGLNTPANDNDGRLFTRPFVSLLAMQAAYGFAFSMFYLLPKYLASVGETAARIGFVMAGFGVACLLTIPFLPIIVERWGRKATLVGANLQLAGAAVVFAVVDRPGLMAVPLRASEGVTWTLMFSTATALTAEMAPRERLAQAIGLAGGASLIMSAVAPAIGEPLADRFGYRSAFLLAALSAVVAAALARRLPIPARAKPVPASAPCSSRVTVPSQRGVSPVRIYAVFGVAGLAFSSLFTFLAPYALGHGVHAIRSFFVGYTSAAIAVRVLGGRMSDRLGHRGVAMAALLTYGCVVASTGLLGPHHLALLGVAFGLAHGAAFPALMALLIHATPPQRRPRALSIANGAMSIGISAVFPAGVLVARLGYPMLFAVVGTVTAAAAALLGRTRIKRG
ncbi:MAG TPA: MFS transporter [Polyangia bacterium]|jgi:predicted MFS family arabinose efflux permease